MPDFIKKNKWLFIVGTLLLVLLLFTALLEKHQPTINKPSQKSHQQMAGQVTDQVTGDNTAESLNALTQELHQVMHSNQTLQANNAKLNEKNASILQHIREEVQDNLENELQKRGQDNQAKIAKLEQQLKTVNQALAKVTQHENVSAMVGNDGSISGSSTVRINGENLVAIPDLSRRNSIAQKHADQNNQTGQTTDRVRDQVRDQTTDHAKTQKTAQPKPYYTIPSGATLARSISMTALIGRVPVDGVVKSPYPFKMIIGSNNMAANGLHIPGVNGAIVQGYTVGDMALSCVKGYVTAITFVFPDGRISTTSLGNAASSLGFSNSLGYISEPNGNPCFSGKFYTNAPKYLATIISLGALNQGGRAYAMAQQTSMSNAFGGSTTSLTGSVGKYMLGGAVQGGTQQAIDWFTQREKNSFDAVYVPAGKKAVINMTKQINIDYDPKGRKIYDTESQQKSHRNTSLD